MGDPHKGTAPIFSDSIGACKLLNPAFKDLNGTSDWAYSQSGRVHRPRSSDSSPSRDSDGQIRMIDAARDEERERKEGSLGSERQSKYFSLVV